MADVKWIKITTDIFDDEKILMIESMPAADSVIVIWFKLLTMAGKQNNNGVFMMANRIAYTDEMLASIFRRDVNVVRMALQVFQQFGMIEIVENVITIPNWGKHQSLDAYEKKKVRDRERIAKKRAEQKALVSMSPDVSPDMSPDMSPDVAFSDKEEEKEKEKEEKESIGMPTAPPAPAESPAEEPQRHRHGANGWVLLTDEQYQKLLHDLGPAELERCITYVDESAQITKNKNGWKDWNLVVRRCHREQWGAKHPKQKASEQPVQRKKTFSEILAEKKAGGAL